MYLAIAIVIAAVLFLIDRNHVWKQTWKLVKWTGIISVALTAATFGSVYLYGVYSDAKFRREMDAFNKAQAVEKAKALADRWNELGALEKDVCGSEFIAVFGDSFPESGEVACATQKRDNNSLYLYSEVMPVPSLGCDVLRSKLPTFTCHIAPPPPLVPERPRVRHLRMTSVIDWELTTTEFGSLKCGMVKPGDIVVLIEDAGGGVKVRTKSGQTGWVTAAIFEVIP